MNSLWWLQVSIAGASVSSPFFHKIIHLLRPSNEGWHSHDLFDSLGNLLRKEIQYGLMEMRWLEYFLPGCKSNDMVMALLHYLGRLDPATIEPGTRRVVVVDGTYHASSNFIVQAPYSEAEVSSDVKKLEPFDLDIALHNTESHCKNRVAPLLTDVLSNCDLLEELGVKVVWFESGRRTPQDLECSVVLGSRMELNKAVTFFLEESCDDETPLLASALEEVSCIKSKWGYVFAFWNGLCVGIVLDRLASLILKRCCPKEQPPPAWTYFTSSSDDFIPDKAVHSRPARTEKTWGEIMSFEQHLRASRGGSSTKSSPDSKSGGSRSIDSITKTSPALHKTRHPPGKRHHTHHHHHHHHRTKHALGLRPPPGAISEPHQKMYSGNPYPIVHCGTTLLAAHKYNAFLDSHLTTSRESCNSRGSHKAPS
eukprot:Protomagalhaensia_wolfi_Nauph_80__3428@NODE_347_length_2714_cov_229_338318_g261_i0_p1_GENE_NODE_347_length_2714_cov_229_338318_g261_i0NODE_347_length_2714_cov_229_338318_g261_i0_p1_ORF_typecomplete_len424_score33_46NicO/PF03824_16/2_1_NODE_347_length_2714_cov_229_338318_g261_i014132684